MMMLHGRLHVFRDGDASQTIELVIPPAFLAETDASAMINAIMLRLPMDLHTLKKKVASLGACL
jgi:hypothetical protein